MKTKAGPAKSASNQPKVKSKKVKERPKSTGKLGPSVFAKTSSGVPAAPSRAAIPAKAPQRKQQLYHSSSHQYRANRKFGMEVAPDVSKLALSRPGIDPKPLISPVEGRRIVDAASRSALNKAKSSRDKEDVEMEDASDNGYNSLFEDDGDDPMTTTPAETQQPPQPPQPLQRTTTTTISKASVDSRYSNTYAAAWDGVKQSPEPIEGKASDTEWESDGFGHEMTSRSLLVHFGNIAQRQSTYPELRYFTEEERVEIGTTKKKIEHILFWGPRMTRLGKVSFTNVSEDFREFWSRYGEKGLWISKVLSLRYAHGEHQTDFGEPQEWFDIELENNNQWQPDVMASLRIANLNVALILGPNWHILIFNAGLSNINRKYGLPHGTGSALRGLFWNVGWDMRNEPLSEEADAFYKNPPLLETNDEESEWVLRQERGIDLDKILGLREKTSEDVYVAFLEATKANLSAESTNEIKKVLQLYKNVQVVKVDDVIDTGVSLAMAANTTGKPPAKFIIFVHWSHQFEMFRLPNLIQIRNQMPTSRFYLYGLRPESLYPEPSKKLVGAVSPFWHEGTTIFMTWGLARDHPEAVYRILAYAEVNQNVRLLVPGDFIDVFYESWQRKTSATTWNTEIYSERAVENASIELSLANLHMIIKEDQLRPDYQKVLNKIQLLNWCPEWENQNYAFSQQLQLEMFDLHLLNSPLATARMFLFVDNHQVGSLLNLQFKHIEKLDPSELGDLNPMLKLSANAEEFNRFVESHTQATAEKQKRSLKPPGKNAQSRKSKAGAPGTK
ncbi:hypothetical protein BJ508DRAFT_26455 [Ascobolus immersus RN42]|uniref:Uncharacterized protein n=1 Tax=Ascobolus immersus RN42 TaxID=1160509 RepID=A0A3N4IJ64_ASCIM|nr:hypothetical protein BJ508DRAFT_26455 [Ascobolus immersus RN42]